MYLCIHTEELILDVVTLLAKVTVPSYYVVPKPKIFQGQ